MAFNSNSGRSEYTATSGQTIFPFVFKIFLDEDIKVYLTPNGQAADDTEDILTLATDYTVSIDGDNGGSITLTSGASLSDSVTLVRQLDINRLIEYQTSGDMLATTLNSDQDYQTYLIADKDSENTRFMRLSESLQGVDTELPIPEALKVMRWKTTEDGLENVSIGDNDVFVNILNKDYMEDLLAVDYLSYETVNIRGYTSINDGGGGLFNYDSTIDKSTANGGTIIDPDQTLTNQGSGVGLGCWIRQYSGAVNVKWFGAKGDGIADDTASIQASLSSNESVFAPKGTYRLTATLLIPTESRFYGEQSGGSILSHDTATSPFDIINQASLGISNITIERLSFNGNGTSVGWTASDGAGIRLTQCSKVKIKDCIFLENSSYGVELAETTDFEISGNYIERSGDDGISISSTGAGAVGGRGVITNNIAFDMRGDAGTDTGTGFEVDDGPSEIVMTGNIATECIVGFDCHTHATESNPSDLIFTGNIANDNTDSGIKIFWFGSEATPKSIIATNNICKGNTNYGIAVISGDGVTIANNEIANNGKHGIFLNQGGNTVEIKNIRINGNNIASNGEVGIKIGDGTNTTNVVRLIIDSNTIYLNGQHGIWASECDNPIISNNTISSNGASADSLYSNIKFNNAVNSSKIHNNQILQGAGANRVNYGIHFAAANIAWCHDNYIDGARAETIRNDAGSTVRMRRNDNYKTENSGVASVLSGTTSISVTHGLDITPSNESISVTALNNLGAASQFWISSIGATTFDIHTNVDPAATASFSWNVLVHKP